MFELFHVMNVGGWQFWRRSASINTYKLFPKSNPQNQSLHKYKTKHSYTNMNTDFLRASSPSSAEPGEFSGCPLVEFRPVSQEFVRDLLKRTPPKSCELDSMPATLMYECMDVLLPSLTQIINESSTACVSPPPPPPPPPPTSIRQ